MTTPAALPIRGVHIDCRAQMLRFPRLVEILGDLSRWGYNAVLLEYEDHFPYRGRLKAIAAEDALTPSQVREIDRIAHGLGIQIIPLVQCLGHLTYVLRLPAFRRLSEGYPKVYPYTICPADPKSRILYQDMVEQVLELHPDSRYFHIGGDEAHLDPSCSRCRRQNAKAGISERLIGHYLDRADWLRSQGPDPILWCDLALAHPEHLDRLRGHAIIMDWDYWSGVKPAVEPHVWGIGRRPNEGRKDPSTWAPLHRRRFQKYIFTDNGKAARPFPYSKFLHDEGFAFMVAPAARSAGDSFCVPRAPQHPDNAVGAARAAVADRSLGYILTSWALRRAPWPLTEYTLLAGSLALKNPDVSRKEIDRAFVLDQFGVNDLSLARIPFLLGVAVPSILQAQPCADLRTNLWLAKAFEDRLEDDRKDLKGSLKQLKILKDNCAEAGKLLDRARPRSARQRERVALWRWAIQVMAFYAGYAPAWLNGEKPVAARKEMQSLSTLSTKLLGRLYTAHTLKEEQQNRFGILDEFLA
ncbi:MAG: family 20 glycosylhydrolase [Kiritimatiellia bacterium]